MSNLPGYLRILFQSTDFGTVIMCICCGNHLIGPTLAPGQTWTFSMRHEPACLVLGGKK